MAEKMGYTNIRIAEAGYPGWTKLYGSSGAIEVQAGGVDGSIDVEQFEKILKENPDSVLIVDVRDPDEFAAGHFKGAKNIPVDKLEQELPNLPKDKPIVYVCATGARSGEAFYMTKDVRPELEKCYYLEATTTFDEGGEYEIKPNK
jgi:3-mercaptopyruvate sulfurtransferase SseA